ncbi:MAG TPA: universal stress protein [Hyphomicrobiaceae bacterium]
MRLDRPKSPRRILLATDLDPRSDRALDRAALLAGEFSAELFVAHVLEDIPDGEDEIPSWRRPPSLVEVARRQLLRQVGAVAQKATILIEQGEPAKAILAAAEREGCDLIVTGVAKEELFGRSSLGATVDGILRGTGVPVLVVKSRASNPYRQIVVATDFSRYSRHALDTAAAFFPDRPLTLFHAYDAPMSLLSSDPDAYRQEWEEAARKECANFLRDSSHDADQYIAFGAPDVVMHDYVLEKGVDLVVLGTRGRSGIGEFFLGSVAKSIVLAVPCDALLVRHREELEEA